MYWALYYGKFKRQISYDLSYIYLKIGLRLCTGAPLWISLQLHVVQWIFSEKFCAEPFYSWYFIYLGDVQMLLCEFKFPGNFGLVVTVSFILRYIIG